MKTCLVKDCTVPATGDEDFPDEYPWACRWHTPDAGQERYPVIVEYTHRHVVWVEGENAAAAARRIESNAYEYTDDQETLVDAGWTASAPEPWDRYTVYGDGVDGPYSTNANAHVEAYEAEQYRVKREADMAACRAAGHPDVNTYPHGTFCRVCGRLPETVAELPEDGAL